MFARLGNKCAIGPDYVIRDELSASDFWLSAVQLVVRFSQAAPLFELINTGMRSDVNITRQAQRPAGCRLARIQKLPGRIPAKITGCEKRSPTNANTTRSFPGKPVPEQA